MRRQVFSSFTTMMWTRPIQGVVSLACLICWSLTPALGQSFSASKNIFSNPGLSSIPRFALERGGRIYVAWKDDSQVRVGIYFCSPTDFGATFSTPTIISTKAGASLIRPEGTSSAPSVRELLLAKAREGPSATSGSLSPPITHQPPRRDKGGGYANYAFGKTRSVTLIVGLAAIGAGAYLMARPKKQEEWQPGSAYWQKRTVIGVSLVGDGGLFSAAALKGH
jgi:hypothetical protein